MEKAVSMNNTFCCLCRNWNNGRGADSLRMMNGGLHAYVDNQEKHQCIATGRETQALYKCNKFAKR